eukprot:TRINITY_DN2845_c0_g2_i1.p1 TRINITY_DN2845_c0_g2~~TRINITY_DN2845_c0_g2_i1.p1  ORF type:complete len:200 (+),score=18.66 TRINITY_DN2845_c0_g2_i1:100-699(+)
MPLIEAETTDTIKYYNDLVWYYYSVIGIPFCHVIWFLTLYQHDDYKKKYLNKLKSNTPPPLVLTDYLIWPFCQWAHFYYIIDTFCHFASFNFLTSWCSFGFMIHHILSLSFLYRVMRYHMTPSIMLLGTFHSWLLAFPGSKLLLYLYLGVVANFHYTFYRKPWADIKNYRIVRNILWMVYVPLVILWLAGCKNFTRLVR